MNVEVVNPDFSAVAIEQLTAEEKPFVERLIAICRPLQPRPGVANQAQVRLLRPVLARFLEDGLSPEEMVATFKPMFYEPTLQ